MSTQGVIRIIAGKWRGTRIPVADVAGLRPTTDRVRETLFNWIAMNTPGSHCLDLFAGTGALGLEAASRDAEKVVMIEQDRTAFSGLQQTVKRLAAENIALVNQNACDWLAQCQQQFDLIFMDPPFQEAVGQQIWKLLQSRQFLADGGLLYLEHAISQSYELDSQNFQLHKEKRFGQVQANLYRYHQAK